MNRLIGATLMAMFMVFQVSGLHSRPARLDRAQSAQGGDKPPPQEGRKRGNDLLSLLGIDAGRISPPSHRGPCERIPRQAVQVFLLALQGNVYRVANFVRTLWSLPTRASFGEFRGRGKYSQLISFVSLFQLVDGHSLVDPCFPGTESPL